MQHRGLNSPGLIKGWAKLSQTLPPLDPSAIAAAPTPVPGRSRKPKRLCGAPRSWARRGDLRNRLRPLGQAPYRHVRRSDAHHYGPHRVPASDRDAIKTRLICFSDDMDGMRKIPDNVPSREALEPYLQMPLTAVPDPWTNEFPSFGEHNNAMLRRSSIPSGSITNSQAPPILQVGQVRSHAAARARTL